MSDNAAYFYNKINEDLQTGGLDVQAEDIIDIIDGYKGLGYGVSTQDELGVSLTNNTKCFPQIRCAFVSVLQVVC